MTLITVPASSMHAINLWPNAAGELAVRPGFRRTTNANGQRRIRAIGSFLHPQLDQPELIVLEGGTNLQVRQILDLPWGERTTTFSEVKTRPRRVYFAQSEREFLIGSPDMHPIWGMVGSHVYAEYSVPEAAPNNPRRSTQPIPNGPVVSWAGRTVYFDDDTLRYSDTFEPRAIIDDNFDNGPWYGRLIEGHVSGSGELLVVAQDGVYAQPAGAAATEVVQPAWRRVTQYNPPGFGSTVVCQGVLFGITPRGVRQLYPPGPTYPLALPSVPIREFDIPGLEDFTVGQLHASEDGPVYSIGSHVWRLHMATGFSSWWERSGAGNRGEFVGIAQGPYGREYWAWETEVCILYGNHDSSSESTTNFGDANDPTPRLRGGFVGRLPSPPSSSVRIRRLEWASDTIGRTTAYVRGRGGINRTANAEPGSFVLGTDTWGAGTKRFLPRPLRSRRWRFNIRNDDITFQVLADHGLTRVGDSIDVTISGPGRARSTR